MSTERAAQHTSGAVNHDRARVEQDGRDSERDARDSEQQRAGGSATAEAECEDWGGAGDGIKGDPQRAGPARRLFVLDHVLPVRRLATQLVVAGYIFPSSLRTRCA